MLTKRFRIQQAAFARAKEKILTVLQEEGYEIEEDLEDHVDHFLSCLSKQPQPQRIQELLHWLGEQRRACPMQVDPIPMQDVEKWAVDPATGAIGHESGEFFQVIGIRVTHGDNREKVEWCQPIIYQQDMGILGILCKQINGVRHYLLQAKAEPGNPHKVLISPTLQATVSNLRRAHGGFKPLFAEYFENPRPGTVIYATDQAEDGGRLYLKTNLNMLVEIPQEEPLEIPDNFRWLTMYEIKHLLKYENVINLHIRSILSPL